MVKATPITIHELAAALLARDDFRLRLRTQSWLRARPSFRTVAVPDTNDPRILVAAAALIELLAERAGQPPPAWTATIGSLPEPFFAVAWAERPGFTRDLCLNESPEPLKRRNIFAPPTFLMMA
ncbi:hypothetical protein EKD04_025535 [Chloroflexales bacterium ZM16-3]|nr:hypothetical protein [Chloroflexales bacterium ZM16-3]